MRLKTKHEAGRTIFLDVDAADREVYALPESGGSIPDDMKEIITEFELCGIVMEAKVTGGGVGWNSMMLERLERRRTDLKTKLMDLHIKENK